MMLAKSSFEHIAEIIRDSQTSAEWVRIMNRHGFRDDVMSGGHLPELDDSGLNTTKKQYLKDRLMRMNGQDELRLTLIDVITLNPHLIELLNPILVEDNYSISINNGKFIINGVVLRKEPDIKISPSFVQSEKMILEALDSAKISIRAALAWFTNQKLADKLVEKHREGVDVSVVVFVHPANINYKVDLNDVPSKFVKGTKGGIMHHKFCVIDNQTVVTGSYNWTEAAETRNDENANVIYGDNALATEYSLEFKRILEDN